MLYQNSMSNLAKQGVLMAKTPLAKTPHKSTKSTNTTLTKSATQAKPTTHTNHKNSNITNTRNTRNTSKPPRTKSVLKSKKYYENFIQKSIRFLQKEAKKRGVENFVVGLSGGIDSAVVACLCKMATKKCTTKTQKAKSTKPKNVKTSSSVGEVFAIALPSLSSSKESLKHAKELATKFDLPLEILPLERYQEDFLQTRISSAKNSTQKSPLPLEMGNFCARLRMALLYDYSAQKKAIVIGTSNKSELMLGYGTIFGDLACAINPIGSLYKSEIFALAKILKIPESIISKPPSAELYAGQSDEAELGFSYEKIDIVLEAICQRYGDFREVKNFQKIDIKHLGDKPPLPKGIAKMVKTRITQNLFKRTLPKIFVP